MTDDEANAYAEMMAMLAQIKNGEHMSRESIARLLAEAERARREGDA